MLNFKGYETLPEHFQGSLERYVTDRLHPGGFMIAVLSGNLYDVYNRADSESLQYLDTLVKFIYNRVPQNMWGNDYAVNHHLYGE